MRLWLDEVTKRMLTVLSQSNAYNALHVIYEELGVFGTGCVLIEEDYDDVIRCQTLTAGEYYLASSGRNQIDTLYREYVLHLGQVVERFGKANCSAQVQGLWASGQLDKEVNVAQAIEPNDDRAPQIPGLKRRKYRSVIWEWGQSQNLVLELKGYFEMPFCAPRWHVIGNDSYGRVSGHGVPGNIQVAPAARKANSAGDRQGAKSSHGCRCKHEKRAGVSFAGGRNVCGKSGACGFKPAYDGASGHPGAEEKIAKAEERIKSTFFADLFLMISQLDSVRTATEIIERKQEKMLMLGPFLERSQFELINPFIKRLFAIMHRAGLVPAAPHEIRGRALDIECVSTLADAQKSTATTGIERLVAFVGNLAAAKPDALDNVDFDETVREYADLIGVTQKLIVAQQKRDAIRKQRAQQAAQQQAAQMSLAGVQGAKTLSETDVGGGQNALMKMIGAAGQ